MIAIIISVVIIIGLILFVGSILKDLDDKHEDGEI